MVGRLSSGWVVGWCVCMCCVRRCAQSAPGTQQWRQQLPNKLYCVVPSALGMLLVGGQWHHPVMIAVHCLFHLCAVCSIIWCSIIWPLCRWAVTTYLVSTSQHIYCLYYLVHTRAFIVCSTVCSPLQVGGDEGQRILRDAVKEIQAMPELKHVDWSKTKAAAGAAGAATGAATAPASAATTAAAAAPA